MLSPLPRYDITKYGKFEIRPYKLGSAFVSVWPRDINKVLAGIMTDGVTFVAFFGVLSLGGRREREG